MCKLEFFSYKTMFPVALSSFNVLYSRPTAISPLSRNEHGESGKRMIKFKFLLLYSKKQKKEKKQVFDRYKESIKIKV